SLSTHESEIASIALHKVGEFRQHSHLTEDNVAELNAATLAHLSVRRASLWRMVADFRDKFHSEPFHVRQVFDYYEVLRPDGTDFEWLLKDIREQTNDRDRHLALRFAVNVAGSDWIKWHRIWIAV